MFDERLPVRGQPVLGPKTRQRGVIGLGRLAGFSLPLQQRRLLEDGDRKVRINLQRGLQGGHFAGSVVESAPCAGEVYVHPGILRLQGDRLQQMDLGVAEVAGAQGMQPGGREHLGAPGVLREQAFQ